MLKLWMLNSPHTSRLGWALCMQLGSKNLLSVRNPSPVSILQHLHSFAEMSVESQACIRIGDTISDFSCESTFGVLNFHEVCDRMMSAAGNW